MNDLLPILRELGSLGIVALMVWKVSVSLDRVERVLFRLEGQLLGRDSHPTPPDFQRPEV